MKIYKLAFDSFAVRDHVLEFIPVSLWTGTTWTVVPFFPTILDFGDCHVFSKLLFKVFLSPGERRFNSQIPKSLILVFCELFVSKPFDVFHLFQKPKFLTLLVCHVEIVVGFKISFASVYQFLENGGGYPLVFDEIKVLEDVFVSIDENLFVCLV